MGEANLCAAKGQREEAVKICMEVIRLAPNAPEPFKTLGELYEDMGDQTKCLQFKLIAVHLSPGDPEEWASLAEMSVELGDLKQAVLCYSKALTKDSKNISFHVKKSKLLERLGEKKKALDGYQSVLKLLSPDEGDRYMMMARDLVKSFHDVGNLEKAEETLLLAFDTHPSLVSSEDINMVAEIQIKLKEYERALKTIVKHCEEVEVLTDGGDRVEMFDDEELNPADVEICLVPDDLPFDLRVKLAICLIFLESTAPPFAVAEKILDLRPDEFGDMYVDLADAFSEMGKYELANKFLEKLVSSRGNWSKLPAVWLRYAECLNAVGDLSASVEAYR